MLSLFMGLTLAVVTSGAAATQSGTNQSVVSKNQNYTLAYKKSVEEHKPLMVVVSAGYCPACDVLKKTTIANMERSGELDAVSVAVVDRDAEPELAKQLMANEKMVPQIIFFTRTEDGRWSRKRLKGYQPVQPVRNLLRVVTSMTGRS
ncbi:Thioredoxin-like [Neorhodopirellula lusitana]|uniref:Thioredoxin-like n=1 Tax=Neorhodopirellula lusitana TaxID=445327 RepID=A0ABY1PYH8_9BACT|nr:thioredoxin family protein [Neorhodopirellula lusitana]SMP53043.1 Thioredoxin-like [Neorhodopirellula lusitana]